MYVILVDGLGVNFDESEDGMRGFRGDGDFNFFFGWGCVFKMGVRVFIMELEEKDYVF